MKTRIFYLLVAGAMAGCAANKTQRAPTVSGPAAATVPAENGPPKRDFVQEVGETTWNVVSAPVRMVTPKKEPAKEPVVYEAPTAVFTRRNYGEEDGAAGGAATRP